MNCEICGALLTGKQIRFCSIRCRNVSAGRISKIRHKPPDKEWLAKEYLLPPAGKGRTQPDLCSELGVSKPILRKWIKQYNLQQDIKERLKRVVRKKKFATPTREWLIDQYIKKDKSIREISDDIGSSTLPVVKWLRAYGISKPSKQLAEKHSKRMSGKNNPAYTNGNARQYVVRKLAEVKPKICEWCNAKKDVQIHHIDHNRQHNEVDNLMWLCGACNRLESNIWILYKSGRATFEHIDNQVIVTFKGV